MTEPIFSVSEFLDLTNELLGQRDLIVQGEVVEAKEHPTGCYFTLKDAQVEAVMECYMNPSAYRGSGIALERGMLLKMGGVANVWKKKGRFSFRVETLALAGEGSLKKAYDALKKKLTEEGLFDRKRPLPEFVSRIGLITSKSGAVIDDFRKNLAPLGIQILHTDVRVEGSAAVGQIQQALEYWNQHFGNIDVLVMIRGGGSLEDLQAFNDEQIVRAVFGARVPTLVSIGHDRDVPLAQLAADASASTPTGAAHTINATWDRLQNIGQTGQRMIHAYEMAFSGVRADMQSSAHRLAVHLARITGQGRELALGFQRGMERVSERILRLQDQVMAYSRQLETTNPERLLKLGYGIVTDETGGVIRSTTQLRPGQAVRTRLAKGTFMSEVKELQSE